MQWAEWLQWTSVGTAGLAAAFWWWSAAIRLPGSLFEMFQNLSTYAQQQALQHIGGVAALDDLDRLKKSLAKQSKLSAVAAIFAGLSALAQTLAMGVQLWANHA